MKKVSVLLLSVTVASFAATFAKAQGVKPANAARQPQKVSQGIAEVTAIEGLAASIKSTKDSIETQKGELDDLEKAARARVAKLNAELAALIKERDDKLRDLRGGFFCSKCGKLKSEFENEGKSFEAHLDEVTGIAIPAPTDRIEALREEYKTKIAYKRVQLQNAQKGDAAVARKRQSIADLEKKLKSLCDEITNRSRSYDKILAAETKSKQLTWLRDLLDYASDIFIAEDKIVILEAKTVKLTKDFEQKSIGLRQEIEKQNLVEREKREKRIADIEVEIPAREARLKEVVGPYEMRSANVKERIAEINAELRKAGLKPEERQPLTTEKSRLTNEAAQIDEEIQMHNRNHSTAVARLKAEIRSLNTEVFRLTADLPKQQDAAVAKLRTVFDKQKADVKTAIVAATAELAQARTAYKTREAFYSKENGAFYDVVADESDRIVIAARDVPCPVTNAARQFVASNWNTYLPCVSTATMRAKPYSTNVFGSYCPKEVTASSFGKYKSFLKALDADDIAAVKANSNVGWYDALFPATK